LLAKQPQFHKIIAQGKSQILVINRVTVLVSGPPTLTQFQYAKNKNTKIKIKKISLREHVPPAPPAIDQSFSAIKRIMDVTILTYMLSANEKIISILFQDLPIGIDKNRYYR